MQRFASGLGGLQPTASLDTVDKMKDGWKRCLAWFKSHGVV